MLLLPSMGAKYCDRRLVYVCLLSVCLSAGISQKSYVQISPNFLHMFPLVVASFCSVLSVNDNYFYTYEY